MFIVFPPDHYDVRDVIHDPFEVFFIAFSLSIRAFIHRSSSHTFFSTRPGAILIRRRVRKNSNGKQKKNTVIRNLKPCSSIPLDNVLFGRFDRFKRFVVNLRARDYQLHFTRAPVERETFKVVLSPSYFFLCRRIVNHARIVRPTRTHCNVCFRHGCFVQTPEK